MTTNIDRAAEVVEKAWCERSRNDRPEDISPSTLAAWENFHKSMHDTLWNEDANFVAQALADAGLLRPGPSSRYDGKYGTSFSRDEEAEEGPDIEAYPAMHRPAPEWKIVHRAEVLLDIGGQYGYQNLRAYATAEWCREAAAILLDVADEVDRKNKETADHAEDEKK